jgi:hypothetical protein
MMARTINPKSLKGAIRTGLTGRMPKRFSVPAVIGEVGSVTGNPPVTFRRTLTRTGLLPLTVAMKLKRETVSCPNSLAVCS